MIQPTDENDILVQRYKEQGGRNRSNTEADVDHISVSVSSEKSYMGGLKSPRGGKDKEKEKDLGPPAGAAPFYKYAPIVNGISQFKPSFFVIYLFRLLQTQPYFGLFWPKHAVAQ